MFLKIPKPHHASLLPAGVQPEMAFPPPKPISGDPIQHQPSFYLSEEASRKRISALIDRMARDGLKSGEAVPASIMVAAEIRRGELNAEETATFHCEKWPRCGCPDGTVDPDYPGLTDSRNVVERVERRP